MSRRKQAKPQHLKSDEELPTQEGAPEHGEGPQSGGGLGTAGRRGRPRAEDGVGSLDPASQGLRRGAWPEQAGRGDWFSTRAHGAESCGRSKLGSAAGSWGATRGTGRGRRGPRRLFHAAPRALCARTWSWPRRPRRPFGGLSGGYASGAHLPLYQGRAALFRAGRLGRSTV